MRNRRITQAALVLGGAMGLVVAYSAPALAYSRAYEGADYAGVGSDLRWVEVCDKERDGNGVYGQFRLNGGGFMQVSDGNGSAGGCGNQTAGSNIYEFRVCEDDAGGDTCTGWVPAAALRKAKP